MATEIRPEQFWKLPPYLPTPILVTELGIVTEVRPVQPLKAYCPILVTEFGIVIEERLEQSWKVASSILVKEFEIVTEVRPLQPRKAETPILVTELGIVREVRPEQFWKAETPILVTLLGIIVFLHPITRTFDSVSMMALQLSLLSYDLFPFSTVIKVILEQSEICPITVTDSGIVIDVRLEQP